MALEQAIFSRLELLLGDMSNIAKKRVIIFGFMLASLVVQDAVKSLT